MKYPDPQVGGSFVHYVAERGQCSMKKPKLFDTVQNPVKSERLTPSELGERLV